ncbi:MAG: CHAT domain-containing protein [Cyanobacteria bacterium P01_H01_bin.26]
MDGLTKATLVFALLPLWSGRGVAIAAPPGINPPAAYASPLLAQAIVPTHNEVTQVISSDQGTIEISGGTSAAGNLFHSFERFNLTPEQTASFLTTPFTDRVIGQVIGGTASSINGLLQVTGSPADLYLINPAGLLFGPNARLDLGGSFTATTATHIGNGDQWFDVLSNPDYSTLTTAPSHFGFSGAGAIVNQGQLAVPDGQSLRLLGNHLTNTGTLSAAAGEVSLVAVEQGQTIRLGEPGGLLNLEITASGEFSDPLPALITGGNLSHSSALVVRHDGTVALDDARDSTQERPFNISNAGNLSVQGTTGGQITLLGDRIQVLDSILNASGISGGGSIQIGGTRQGQGLQASQTVVTDTASLIADATDQGNGGLVMVWSDQATFFGGTASAQSAMGNGGLIETSSASQLTIGDNTRVNTLAPRGETGLWLVDPTDLSIVDAGGTAVISPDTNDPVNGSINASTVVSALNSTHVTLQADNSITVDAAIDASGNSAANNLAFDTNTLNLNAGITLKDSGRLAGTASVVNVGAGGRIQNGVDAVANQGTVNLAAATYREGDTITLDRALSLVGQGQNRTYISGDADNNGGGNHRVLSITSSGDKIALSRLTIQDGLSSSAGAGLRSNGDNILISDTTFFNNEVTGDTLDGGAIQNTGSLTLRNTVFDNNRTGSDGGAIDILQGSVNVLDSTFTNNRVEGHGGAIDVDPNGSLTVANTSFSLNQANQDGGAIFSEGTLTIEDASFIGNIASNSSGGGIFSSGAANLNALYLDGNSAGQNGGGLYNDSGGTSTITAGQFINNLARSGGGLYNQGELSLQASVVSNNQSIGLGLGGGGIYNALGGVTTVTQSLISNNRSATNGGGILNVADGELTRVAIAQSAIVGNQAAQFGGGIEIASMSLSSDRSQLDITNSTISGNQASIGGGIRTVGPTTLTNVTITNNMARLTGGGLSDNLDTPAIPALINTIVAGNRAPTNPDVEGLFIDQGNNLIGIDQGSQGFNTSILVGSLSSPIEPGLAALNSRTGSLPSHQLLTNSPAVNGGNNAVATPSDQQGRPRIVDGTVDIGAIESDSLPASPPLSPPTPPLPPTSPPETAEPPQQPTAQVDTPLNPNIAETINQEEKLIQPLAPEQDLSGPVNGRLRYFDEDAFRYLEDAFSADYSAHWQLPQGPSVTLQDAQRILQQARQNYRTQSAIIYAVFVPQGAADPVGHSLSRVRQRPPQPDDQLMLILVTETGQPIQQLIDVSRAELTQQTKLFRLAVSDPEDDLSYRALARQMYTWLLAPLHGELANHSVEHVMYSLDQGLRTIPLAAMMQGDKFVVEQYGVSIIPSVGLLQTQFDQGPHTPNTLIAGADQFTTLEALPAVPIELDIVAQHTQTTQVLLNEAFTLDNFIDQQISQQPGLLHLATHAEFNTGSLDQSFIQLWDTQLTFDQMRELNWSELELLILSACETALSSPEAELGFVGLAAAAGIETSMGSLWNVSDVGTLALMAEFYTQLSQSPRRLHALQKAQLSIIRGGTKINSDILNTSHGTITLPSEWDLPISAEFSHPFYWAGFTMVGNPWH